MSRSRHILEAITSGKAIRLLQSMGFQNQNDVWTRAEPGGTWEVRPVTDQGMERTPQGATLGTQRWLVTLRNADGSVNSQQHASNQGLARLIGSAGL